MSEDEAKGANASLVDQIELRRFVGRELLLWIWFESEVLEATLATKRHGSFGLWLEGRLVLNEERESTVIKGSLPGRHREAKESLLRGKTPERMGLHVSLGDKEISLTLRGETLGIAALSPPGKSVEAGAGPQARGEPAPEEGSDAAHEAFYDRMHHARDVEALVEALYQSFLTLRLAPEWRTHVRPAIEAWIAGDPIDEKRYLAAKKKLGLG